MLELTKLNSILHSFKIKADCVATSEHRHLAFYDLKLAPSFRIKKLEGLLPELSLVLKTKTTPFLQMIPEQGIVRLQVVQANQDVLLLEKLYPKGKPTTGILPFCFGETNEGKPFWVEMNNNPHLLVAGTTGSGKSTLLHNLIWNAFKTENVELYLADPKKVEFEEYRNHDLVYGFAQTYNEVCSTLEHLFLVMEERYKILASSKAAFEFFSKIILIIDEVADLMLQDVDKRFENLLTRLAAKCRAAGIYLVIATQRPSVNVVTGLIKANFPARLACKVASRIDSQIILDENGAETLLGKGDALFKNGETSLTRIQIAYVEKK